jgi:muconate cycloisomerase
VRLSSDTGHSGVGETGRSESEDSVQACAAAVHGFDLRGFRLNRLPLPDNESAYAFEVALLDLLGKILEVPVHQLLGGKAHSRVPVDYWMGRCTVEDTARRARRARELGFFGIKIKCTREDPVVERVAAIQENLPGAGVTLDPNERFYDPGSAMELAGRLAGRKGILFESPVPQNRLDWYASLRGKLGLPVALHLIGAKAVLEAIGRGAADCYNLSTGSPSDFVFCARMCEAAGCPVWHGSRMELGILDMAHIHAAAAAPACTLPSDFVGNLMREDDLITEAVRIENGYAVVPDLPGLGVELDMDALERYRVRAAPAR